MDDSKGLPRFYTEADLADLFQIEVRQVARLRRRQSWPHFRVGREVRFTEAQVSRIVEAHTVRTAPALELPIQISERRGATWPNDGSTPLVRTPKSAARRRS